MRVSFDMLPVRMIFIVTPPGRIPGDVIADRRQVGIVADDVFETVPLPNLLGGEVAQQVDAFG